MYLLINLAKKDIIALSLFDAKKRRDKSFDGQNRELLFFVDKFLREEKIKPTDLAGVAVVVGEGGFTSTRLATTLANSFAYALQIPTLAVTLETVNSTDKLIGMFANAVKGQYISATYSGEPNIGFHQSKVA